MLAKPEPIPDTTPDELIVPMEVVPELQVPPGTELPSAVVPAWHTLSVPVIGPGEASTVIAGVTFAGVLTQPAEEVTVKLYTPVDAVVAGTYKADGIVVVAL